MQKSCKRKSCETPRSEEKSDHWICEEHLVGLLALEEAGLLASWKHRLLTMVGKVFLLVDARKMVVHKKLGG